MQDDEEEVVRENVLEEIAYLTTYNMLFVSKKSLFVRLRDEQARVYLCWCVFLQSHDNLLVYRKLTMFACLLATATHQVEHI